MHSVRGFRWVIIGALLGSGAVKAGVLADLEGELERLVDGVASHVVTVRATVGEQAGRFPLSGIVNVGSGIVVDSAGYVLTAVGVVLHGSAVAPTITVVDRGKRSHEALLFGIDADLRIAVLFVPDMAGLEPLANRSSDLRVGSFAVVVGNSFGVGPAATLMTVAGERERDGFSQLSTPATPGLSGAPVFDSNRAFAGIIVGEVAGQTIDHDDRPLPAVMVTSTRLGPLLRKLERLASRRGKPWLGVAVRPLVGAEGEIVVIVTNVVAGSPAEAAGLRRGDVVVSVDSVRFSYVADFADWLHRSVPGHNATVSIVRHGVPETLTLTVGRK